MMFSFIPYPVYWKSPQPLLQVLLLAYNICYMCHPITRSGRSTTKGKVKLELQTANTSVYEYQLATAGRCLGLMLLLDTQKNPWR